MLVILAALAMMIAVPLHAAHNHGHEAGSLHAPCAVCQLHAPVGAPDDIRPLIIEPDGPGYPLPAPIVEFVPATCGNVHACRAPPILLAT